MTRSARKAKFTPPTTIEVGGSENQVRMAKVAVAKVMHPLAPAIRALSLVFLEAKDGEKLEAYPGVPMTMGVDKYYRCYINPNFVTELVKAAEEVTPDNPCFTCGATSHYPLAYIGGVLGHEAYHLVRKHSNRCEAANLTDLQKFNTAADMEINDDLLTIFKDSKPLLCLPPSGTYAKYYRDVPLNASNWDNNPNKGKLNLASSRAKAKIIYDNLSFSDTLECWSSDQLSKHGPGIWSMFTDNKLAEEYYMLLPEDTPPNGHDHGSGVGGERRRHEQGPPNGKNPGVSEAEGRTISREVANNVRSRAAADNMPAGMDRWANGELGEAKYDWRQELAKVCRYGAGRKNGSSMRSYRRLGLLTASTRGKVLFPMKYDPVPDITVVFDTSGSMCELALKAGLEEVKGVMTAVGANIRLTSVDSEASELQNVTTIENVKLSGGGGTNMCVGIACAMKDPERIPSVIIVMTDGYTPWPSQPVNGGLTTLICCLVGEDSNELTSVPSWAMGIKIEGENPEVRNKEEI